MWRWRGPLIWWRNCFRVGKRFTFMFFTHRGFCWYCHKLSSPSWLQGLPARRLPHGPYVTANSFLPGHASVGVVNNVLFGAKRWSEGCRILSWRERMINVYQLSTMTSFTSTNVKLRLRLTFTWHSPDTHLNLTWPPDHHLTFPWPLQDPNLT